MLFALGLATSLAYIPGITGSTLPTGWALLSLTLPLTLWVPTDMTPFHKAGAAFLAYTALSAFWSPEPWDAIWRLWQFSILALAFRLGSTNLNLTPLWKGLAIGVSASSVIAILQHSGYSIVSRITDSPGIYYNGVAAGAITAITIVALASADLWRWTIPLIPGLLLSGSRGAIFAGTFGLLVTIHRHAWLAIIPIGAAFFITIHLGPSDLQRFTIWRAAYHHLTWFGNGAGSFLSLFITTNGALQHVEYAHNDPLQLLFEFGIGCLSLLPFGLLYVQFWHPSYPIIATFLLLALVAMPLHIPIAAFAFAVASGRIARDWHLAWIASDSGRFPLAWAKPFPIPTQLGLSQ